MIVSSLSSLNMLFHCFLSYLVSNEKSALNLIEHPLYVMSFFFFSLLTSLKVICCFFCLLVSEQVIMCLGIDLFAIALLGMC